MSRRPGARFTRGRIPPTGAPPPAPPTALDPLTIVSSTTSALFLIADLGVTIGTGVAAWADQSGNVADGAQAVGANQPTLQAAVLGGRNTILFDGVGDFLNLPTFSRPTPTVTNSWYWCVFRQITWATNDTLFGTSATAHRLFQSAATPGLTQRNGGTLNGPNNDAPLGTWVSGAALFTGSVSDSTKFGAGSPMTGVNSGNTNAVAGAFSLGAYGALGTSPINAEVALFGCWSAQPTPGELADLKTWVNAYYGVTVVT